MLRDVLRDLPRNLPRDAPALFQILPETGRGDFNRSGVENGQPIGKTLDFGHPDSASGKRLAVEGGDPAEAQDLRGGAPAVETGEDVAGSEEDEP